MALNIDPEQIDVGPAFDNGNLSGGAKKNLRDLLVALDLKLASFGGTPGANSITNQMLQDDIVTQSEIEDKAIEKRHLNFSLPVGYASAGSDLPVGSIIPYADGSCPVGWFCCDGKVMDVETDPGLAAILGIGADHKWGAINPGDGKFNLPDFRGRALIGMGSGSAYSTRSMGDAMGEETHLLESAEMPKHQHSRNFYLDGGNAHNTPYNDAKTYAGTVISDPGTAEAQDTTFTNIESEQSRGPTALYGSYSEATSDLPSRVLSNNSEVGGDESHNNMQPSIAVNWLIKSSADLPGIPLNLDPLTGTAGTATQQLRWSPVVGASSYHVQVSLAAAVAGVYAATVFDSTDVVHTAATISPAIAGTGTRYWHVAAKNASGTSAFSDDFTFVVS